MERFQERIPFLLEFLSTSRIQFFPVCRESWDDVAPIGVLGEVHNEMHRTSLLPILYFRVFILCFDGLDLDSVIIGAVRNQQVCFVSVIE